MRGCTLRACPEGPAPSSPSGCHVGTPTTRGRRRSPLDLGQQQYFATTPKGRPQHLFESVSVAPPPHQQSRGFFGAPEAFGHNKYPPEGARHPRGARRGGRRPFGGGGAKGTRGVVETRNAPRGHGRKEGIAPRKTGLRAKTPPTGLRLLAHCTVRIAPCLQATRKVQGSCEARGNVLGGAVVSPPCPPLEQGGQDALRTAARRCALRCAMPPAGCPRIGGGPPPPSRVFVKYLTARASPSGLWRCEMRPREGLP